MHDTEETLADCLQSLLAQTVDAMEIVVVDDGSTDASASVAQQFADNHAQVRVVRQARRGAGAARNTGAARATGAYLAFCDSDDEVPPGAYQRLVAALERSGSDLAVGSVAFRRRGVYREPDWARRSNPARRLGVSLDDVPELMANLLPGTRVFRRSFWDGAGLAFPEGEAEGDVPTMVRAFLAADRLDVVPAVAYRWHRRDDDSSLLQRDLAETRRARARLAELAHSLDLVVDQTPGAVQEAFAVALLQTSVQDLARATVLRDDAFRAAVQAGTQRLLERLPRGALEQVRVEDRVVALLCAHGEHAALEDFLDYVLDHPTGLPFQDVDGHPHILLPPGVVSAVADEAARRVPDAELRYRTRLSHLAWTTPSVLTVEGGAFVEYLADTQPGLVALVLTERSTGESAVVPTVPCEDPSLNRWAMRAFEDRRRAAFRAEIDIASLPAAAGAVYDVTVRLDARGGRHEAPFQARRRSGSPTFLEPSEGDRVRAVPAWSPARGLSLELAEAPAEAPGSPGSPSGVVVDALEVTGDTLVLEGECTDAAALRLVGPRCATPWCDVRADGARFRADVSLLLDEWGLGPSALPEDEYQVVCRAADGTVAPVLVSHDLWRSSPVLPTQGGHLAQPWITDGALSFRLAPERSEPGSYERRRLRDDRYPAARQQPLLDVAVFDTFAGRAAGDNPGPVCEELARRDAGLDLVFAVTDHSVAVPSCSRAVVRGSAEWFEVLARARYVVSNAVLPRYIRKRPGQVFLQTWHGSPLKRLGLDREARDLASWEHHRHLTEARGDWDFLLSQGPFCTEALRRAFRYDGEVLELGYPRNDVLSSPEADVVRRRTRKNLGIPEQARVILYAPTFRDNQRLRGSFAKDIHLDAHAVVAQVPDTVILVRGHYLSMRGADAGSGDRAIQDVTRYPDIAHLYLAADVLVTDYSSVFFDFALTDKPMYFLAPDLAEYRDVLRGFYLDYHATVPGPVLETTEEVVDALRRPDEHQGVRARFRAEYAPYDDGHASARVVDALLRGPGGGATIRP